MPALTPTSVATSQRRSAFDDEVADADRSFNRQGAIMGSVFAVVAILMMSFAGWLLYRARKQRMRRQRVVQDMRLGHASGNAGLTSSNNALYVPPPVYSATDPNAPTPLYQPVTTTSDVTSFSSTVGGGGDHSKSDHATNTSSTNPSV